MTAITPAQDKVLRFIQSRPISPTVREVMDGVGLASSGAVQGHINALIERGFLRRIPQRARGLEVISRVPSAADFARYTDAELEQIAALHTAERRARADRALGVRTPA